LAALFSHGDQPTRLLAVDIESLILMKRTQRAKDYAVIGELAALLPPDREVDLTTNVDRIIELASSFGRSSSRPAVRAVLSGAGRRAVIVSLAEEIDAQQQEDRRRMSGYEQAAQLYLEECRASSILELPLREAHARLCEVADRLLPREVLEDAADADAQ
jgi:hypothetical protein